MRLIDADAIDYDWYFFHGKSDDVINYTITALKTMQAILDEEPAVDAEQITRCKDCKHCKTDFKRDITGTDKWDGKCTKFPIIVGGEFYCGCAEKMDG